MVEYWEADYHVIRYSGKERDRSGLYYYGARYYVPWLGRWLNPDPAGTVDGLNLLCMVNNNPIKFLDTDRFDKVHFKKRYPKKKTDLNTREKYRPIRELIGFKDKGIVKNVDVRAMDISLAGEKNSLFIYSENASTAFNSRCTWIV